MRHVTKPIIQITRKYNKYLEKLIFEDLVRTYIKDYLIKWRPNVF